MYIVYTYIYALCMIIDYVTYYIAQTRFLIVNEKKKIDARCQSPVYYNSVLCYFFFFSLKRILQFIVGNNNIGNLIYVKNIFAY